MELGLKWSQGQVDPELDQPRGRRGAVRLRRAARAEVRRRARRRHDRRGSGARDGRHPAAQARDRAPQLHAPDGEVRGRARRHHLRSARLPVRDRRREVRRQRRRDDRRNPGHQGGAAGHAHDPRHLERQLRPAGVRARSAELGLPLPLDARGPRSRDRQHGEDRPLRDDPRGGEAPLRGSSGTAATTRWQPSRPTSRRKGPRPSRPSRARARRSSGCRGTSSRARRKASSTISRPSGRRGWRRSRSSTGRSWTA